MILTVFYVDQNGDREARTFAPVAAARVGEEGTLYVDYVTADGKGKTVGFAKGIWRTYEATYERQEPEPESTAEES